MSPSRTSTFPQKPASFIFQPCIFNSCSHLGKTGHFMELIPGIHQHSVRQHGSQIFLCQKHTGQKKSCKKIGHTDDQLCRRHDEPKKEQFSDKKAVVLHDHSDVVELLVPHPKVIYSKKKQTRRNPLTTIHAISTFQHDFLSLHCQILSSLFASLLVFAAQISRLKH